MKPPVIEICHETDKWIYGTKTHAEENIIIPFMKLKHHGEKRAEWKNGKWNPITRYMSGIY